MNVQSQEDGPTAPAVEPAPNGSSARRLSAATAASLLLRVLGIAVGMVTTSVLARYLEPSGYGLFSLALTLGTAAAQLADLGIAVTVASRIARDSDDAGRTLGTGLAIRTTVAVVATIGLLGAAFAGYFGASGDIIAVVALATPLSAAAVLTAGAMARFKPQVSAVLAFIQGLLWLGAVVLVSATRGDMLVLAWLFVAVTTLQTVIGVAMNRRIVPLARPTFTEARRILGLSWPLAVTALSTMVYYRLNSVILFQARGAEELGYFSAAYKVIDVAQLGPGLLVSSLLPVAAASLSADARRRLTVFGLATRVGMVIGVGTAVALVALAPAVVKYLFGSGYEPATVPLILLAISFVGITLGWIGTTICTAAGMVRPIAMVAVPLAVLSLGAQLWVCPRWGATGAAAVGIGTELVMGVAVSVLAARAMAARLPVGRMLLTLAAGAAAVAGVLLLSYPWWLETAFAVGMIAVAVAVFRVITPADLRRVLSKNVL